MAPVPVRSVKPDSYAILAATVQHALHPAHCQPVKLAIEAGSVRMDNVSHAMPPARSVSVPHRTNVWPASTISSCSTVPAPLRTEMECVKDRPVPSLRTILGQRAHLVLEVALPVRFPISLRRLKFRKFSVPDVFLVQCSRTASVFRVALRGRLLGVTT
jgi:hypothetical protein